MNQLPWTAQRRAPLTTVLTVVVMPSVAAQPRRTHDSPSSPGAYDGSPQTPSPLPSPAPRGPAPTCRKLFLAHMRSGETERLPSRTVPEFHNPSVHPASGSALSAALCRWICPWCWNSP